MKKNVWKILLLVLLIVIIVCIAILINKVRIINKFISVQRDLKESENYHIKVESDTNNMVEVFFKNGEYIYISKTPTSEQMYFVTDEEKLLIVDSGDTKIYSDLEFTPQINEWPNQEYYVSDSFIDTLKLALSTSIKTEEYNGEEVYCLSDKNVKTWIDKDTYYTLKTNNGGVKEYDITLNAVSDNDLIRPDLTGYTKQ